jgi:Zn-dependent protease
MEPLALGAVWYVIFLLSTTMHESAHAWAALRGGDPTAFHGGQVSLSPLPHIQREPLGTVVVPLASFLLSGWMIGWASAPYDPLWQRRYPHRAAWMALAGPAANLALLLAAAGGIRVGVYLGVFEAPERAPYAHIVAVLPPGGPTLEFLATFLSILLVLNLILFTFNLLPVPPLDGHTGITLFMSEAQALRFLDWSRQSLSFLGLLVAWVFFRRLFDPVFMLVLNLLYPEAHYR